MRRREIAFIVALAALVEPTPLSGAGPPTIEAMRSIITGPSLLDRFRRPMGLAADSRRGIFVIADTGNRRIATFDAAGRSRGVIPLCGDVGRRMTRQPPSREPSAVALDARGRIFVLDALSREIEVLAPTGSRLATFRPALRPEIAAETSAQSLAVGASGRLYILCAGERSGVLVTEPDGREILSLGFEAGDGPLFVSPVFIAINEPETRFAVVDPRGERAVHVFAVDGTPITAFGPHGAGEGTFSMAVHATWGPEETLWITDTIRHSISIFDSDGNYLGRIGGFGRGPGEFNYPAGCAFLSRDRLLVLERAGARCQLFEMKVEGSGTPAFVSTLSVPQHAEPMTAGR